MKLPRVGGLLRFLVPRSLYGQLALIIILGIATSQLIGVFLSLREYQRGGSELFTAVIVERVASNTRLFETLRPEDRERIAAALSRPTFNMSVAATRAETASGQEELKPLHSDVAARLGGAYEVAVGIPGEALAAEIARRGYGGREPGPEGERRMRPPPEESVWAYIQRVFRAPRPNDPGAFMRQPRNDNGQSPLIQVRLSDGSWLRFHSHIPTRVFTLPPLLIFNWTLLFAAALVVSVIAAQLVVRPLKRLANAADTLSRDLNARPLNETGPAEVCDAARAFNRMHDRLATYLNSRARMLMAMSHDLKTPLTRMRLRSELLQENEVSDRMKADLAEMESLVMSTLDYLRGSGNGESAVAVEIAALVSAICEDHPVWCRQVTVEATGTGPLVAKAQPLLLRRAFSNLIDNAVRYGERADIRLARTGAGEIEIVIRDHGPGIPADAIGRVFEPFFRVEDSRNRATGGTGLGLAIAREIIEAHDGRVELVNVVGGLEARVVLPAGR